MIKFTDLLGDDVQIMKEERHVPLNLNIPWIEKYRPSTLHDIVYQDDVIKMLRKVLDTGTLPHLLFFGPSGVGKCFGIDTPILMFDGSIKMVQDIQLNDQLMGDNNTPRTVLSVCQGYDQLYNIHQKNRNHDYVVNSHHILCLKQNKDTCEISVANYLKQSRLWRKSYKGYRSNKITCWPLKPITTDPYEYGLTKGDSINNTEYIEDQYKINTTEIRYQILAGFIDSCIKHDRYTHISNQLVNDILFIGNSLGLNYTLNLDNSINMTIDQELKSYMKSDNIEIDDKIETTYNIRVKELSVDYYYGFELNGNGRFLLGDFTVTHNTSTILAIAMELFGPNIFKERVIELNASDERGINIVRNKIGTIAKSSIGSPDPKYPCPPYKIIILDEADAMTSEAQAALRKTMEERSHITRFCYICNYINQIIEPITSRCVKVRFKPLNDQSIVKKLTYISDKENLSTNEDALSLIAKISNGDMRRAIMILQNLKYLGKTTITIDDIYKISNRVPIDYLNNLFLQCLGNISVKSIINITDDLRKSGYPTDNILQQLTELVIDSNILTDKTKSQICKHMALTEKRLIDGADEYLQLLSLITQINRFQNN